MIKAHIEAIKTRLANAENLSATERQEINTLITELETEASHLEDGSSPAETEDSEESSFDDLRSRVAQFESSHPRLSGVVGRLATTLSNMGI